MKLLSGDLLFFDADNEILKQALIKLITGNPIHVGVILNIEGNLSVVHASKQKKKIVIEPLKKFFKTQTLHIYRVKKRQLLNIEKLKDELFSFIGKKYGIKTYLTVALAVFLKLPPEKFKHGDFNKYNPHCAALVSRAFRIAGLDLRPDLPDVLTLPRDLIKSKELMHLITFPDGREILGEEL